MAIWRSHGDSTTSPYSITSRFSLCTFSSYQPCGIIGLIRRDILSALVSAGCSHLAVKILTYLDSTSLLSASLVSRDWQGLLLANIYGRPRFRDRVRKALFSGKPSISRLTFSLDMARAAVVDIAVDDNLNMYTLALIADKPHVMVCSLLTHGKGRWVHRFTEQNLIGLTCISAGLNSLVAVGDKLGRILVYEASTEFKCLRLTAILAHHSGAIHDIIFVSVSPTNPRKAPPAQCVVGQILSCSEDMTVGLVSVMGNGSLTLSKLFHGHVSRVRAIHAQESFVLSGSDDRSVKLWSLDSSLGPAVPAERPLATLTGHSGPVTGVLLALPNLAFSAAGYVVRLWDVTQQTCLKLFQHEVDCPVTTMTWISTFRGIATVDASGTLRTFRLDDPDATRQEIVAASSLVEILPEGGPHDSSWKSNGEGNRNKGANCHSNVITMQKYSPKQSLKFYGSLDPRLVTAWPENAVLKIESIPHHFSGFSLRNLPHPSVTIHCLDYVNC